MLNVILIILHLHINFDCFSTILINYFITNLIKPNKFIIMLSKKKEKRSLK